MAFIKSAAEPAIGYDNAYFFIFSKNNIVVMEQPDNSVSIPCIEQNTITTMKLNNICFIGTVNNLPCYCAHISAENLQNPYKLINLRALFNRLDDEFLTLSGYARQIYDWNMNFKFCGRCGTVTTPHQTEHARVCPKCALTSYPRISPAIIIAIVKNNQILLAKGVNFPNKDMFSVLAGFVEPGESLEDCIHREIFEEVGIRVKNVQYFKSQSWPFPDSLMIGFTAFYKSGELNIDPNEIVEAGWFEADTLPLVPGKQALAGELIDWFVQMQGK